MTNKEAIEYLERLYMMADITDAYGDMDDTEPYETAINMAVKALSDVPDTNVGKWIPVTNGRGGHECSLCHTYAPSYKSGDEWLTDYCPNCGVRMEGE